MKELSVLLNNVAIQFQQQHNEMLKETINRDLIAVMQARNKKRTLKRSRDNIPYITNLPSPSTSPLPTPQPPPLGSSNPSITPGAPMDMRFTVPLSKLPPSPLAPSFIPTAANAKQKMLLKPPSPPSAPPLPPPNVRVTPLHGTLPPLPFHGSTIFITKNYAVDDRPGLSYIPWFGDDDREDLVSDVFDVRNRQNLIDNGPWYVQERMEDYAKRAVEAMVGGGIVKERGELGRRKTGGRREAKRGGKKRGLKRKGDPTSSRKVGSKRGRGVGRNAMPGKGSQDDPVVINLDSFDSDMSSDQDSDSDSDDRSSAAPDSEDSEPHLGHGDAPRPPSLSAPLPPPGGPSSGAPGSPGSASDDDDSSTSTSSSTAVDWDGCPNKNIWEEAAEALGVGKDQLGRAYLKREQNVSSDGAENSKNTEGKGELGDFNFDKVVCGRSGVASGGASSTTAIYTSSWRGKDRGRGNAKGKTPKKKAKKGPTKISAFSDPAVPYSFSPALCVRAYMAMKGDPVKIAKMLGCEVEEVERCLEENGLEANPKSLIPPKFKSKQKNQCKMPSVQLNKHQNKKIHAPFQPCVHSGPCTKANGCSCIENVHFCTKHCVMGRKSTNFFPGCRCRNGQCNTKACPCLSAKRECDPDLCRMCGAGCDEPGRGATTQRCRNDSIGMRRKRHLLVAESGVKGAGFGLYTKEGLKKDQFIQEYVGELITQEEADRRGRIYDKVNRSYLFNLNSEFVVDASRKGNKTKFANHDSDPNCYTQVKVVNGDHRIGLFALRDIAPQSELFFDYRYEKGLESDLLTLEGVTVDWMKDGAMANQVSKKSIKNQRG
ncbi:hypothetical protein TrRE_jg12203 [Triparma retinervis]|uniref:Histone-lysine N-methyltransferase n=1 Tax=Triparma retinervis TaxID=2557542 RepID=A0A9W7AIE3_9STRA|nr:hypothetical protein TrRE_jg12203 [Triparma retinervis]